MSAGLLQKNMAIVATESWSMWHHSFVDNHCVLSTYFLISWGVFALFSILLVWRMYPFGGLVEVEELMPGHLEFGIRFG